MVRLLTKWAAARGYEIAWGPVAVVDEVRCEIEARRTAGELDADFDREHLSWIREPQKVPMPDARSVIVIVVPRPAHTVTFTLVNGPFSAVVPPTYVNFNGTYDGVRRDLAASGFSNGHRLEVLAAPLKALAARLGLVSYGRNNITYSSRFGSYHQLVGLITDVELASPSDRDCSPPDVLPRCESCEACNKACPTGAIGDERFLLHAERCLSLYNENTGPWPEFVTAAAHRCLVGCLACQKSCPLNEGLYREESTGVSFSADETAALLADSGDPLGTLDREVLAKLGRLRMTESVVLGRNLRALLERRRRTDNAA
ncbi:MAG: 4Fe-4S double cluster binding domain-containing protein [Planctomycetota bacterium]|jgi:epoxyqueuosine reductase